MDNKLRPRLPIFLFIFFPKESEMVAAVISLTGYILTIVVYVRIYKVVKYHQNQIYSQNQLQNAQTREAHKQRKSAYNSLFVSVVFIACYFPFFFLYHTVHLVYRRSICVGILSFPEFIIKSSCLLLAVPRDSPNCKKHSEENNLHEREYNTRKELNLRIVLTKNVMQSFFGTKLSEKMQWTCYATKTKETCERERLAYSTPELVSLERET